MILYDSVSGAWCCIERECIFVSARKKKNSGMKNETNEQIFFRGFLHTNMTKYLNRKEEEEEKKNRRFTNHAYALCIYVVEERHVDHVMSTYFPEKENKKARYICSTMFV